MNDNETPRKALLCFHGTGSKGSIFNVQMARICSQLEDAFEFIFIDGPRECGPGPGVLPVFEGQAPYRGWFGGYDTTIDSSMREIHAAVRAGLNNWRASQVNGNIEIVGAVGFSEGGLALAMMLWLQQEQQRSLVSELLPALPPLQFAVISCCFFPREASSWLNARAQSAGITKALIDIPTLHIHGNRDFCLGRARQLVRNHYLPANATVVQVETSHHMPTQKNDVDEVVKQIRRLAGVNAID